MYFLRTTALWNSGSVYHIKFVICTTEMVQFCLKLGWFNSVYHVKFIMSNFARNWDGSILFIMSDFARNWDGLVLVLSSCATTRS
jgi:hypothetical protein